MAKWGEVDPRWIVEERPDATNVNNWHWYEHVYLESLNHPTNKNILAFPNHHLLISSYVSKINE